MKDQKFLVKTLESMGPELFPLPQADGKITSNLLKHTGISKLGLMTACDANSDHISHFGLENMLGHAPAGTTFKQVNHFRQLVCTGRFQKYSYDSKSKN